MLEKSETVAPLLVKLYESQKLYSLAKDKRSGSRMELTGAITDLLSVDISNKERDLVAEVLISLMKQAELDLRQTLSEKLAMMDDVPVRLLLHIAHDEISVAAPVLKKSLDLGDFDLLYIIKSQSAEYWREIAQRQDMGDSVIDALADSKDITTAINLADNNDIVLTKNAINNISSMVRDDENVALALFRRDEVPETVRAALYRYVSNELKVVIEQEYGSLAPKINSGLRDAMVDLVGNEFRSEAPNVAMVHAAQRFMKAGKLTSKMMIKTLKHGQLLPFIAQFAVFSKMSTQKVQEMLMQPCGQGLALSCKAMGIGKNEFISLFLLVQKNMNLEKSTSHNDVNEAMMYYDRVKEKVAQRILRGSQVDIY